MGLWSLSRCHLTTGSGVPVALHVRVALPPSLTVTSELVPSSAMRGGVLTSRYPLSFIMGSVLIWHMYSPSSLGLTLRMARRHSRSFCVTEKRSFLEIKMLFMERMVEDSTCTQAIL